jgi:hypothetical protein
MHFLNDFQGKGLVNGVVNHIPEQPPPPARITRFMDFMIILKPSVDTGTGSGYKSRYILSQDITLDD